jgi:hypothetical protein
MPNDLRVRAADHYNAPESTDYVFLISSRAGDLCINLATADTVSYLTQTGTHRTVFRWNLVRIASDNQMTFKYFDCLAEKLSTKLSLNERSGNACSNILLFMVWNGMNKTRTQRTSSANKNSRPFCDLDLRNSSK